MTPKGDGRNYFFERTFHFSVDTFRHEPAPVRFQGVHGPFTSPLHQSTNRLVALVTMTAYGDMRARVTPIPTPCVVRAVGSLLVGVSVAVMLSGVGIATKVGIATTCVLVTVVLAFAHPYRSELRAYARDKKADTFPTVGQIMPLMLWWLILMLAPVVAPWPAFAVVITGIVSAGLAWILFPHVDGARKLAFA
ncbi:hypothetical protein [Corynebacterium cystitidis]|uniref:hypothetical protein n=1 Tax=Corynebacterium cystitidis TaxID=35757 RepID=UPI00211E54EE|nr:hypothetical protein [Corynebacterium cystitidis]